MKKTIKLLIVMLLSVTLLTGCDFVNDIRNGITGDPYYSDYEIQQRLNEVKYHASQLFNDVFYELKSYAEEDLNTASQVIDMSEIEERMAYYIEQLQNDEEFMQSLGSSYENVVQTYEILMQRALVIQQEIKDNPPQPHVHMEYLEDIDLFNTARSRFATLVDKIINR